MLFSSITFLYYFLPLVLIVYFALPKAAKNTVLLISSLIFYGWGEPQYVFLMIASIIVGYVSGLLIEAFYSKNRKAKLILTAAIGIHLGLLGYFKYADFFIGNFNEVTGVSVPLLRLALPIGISFYTFQIISYEMDVYRREAALQKNLISLACYVAMFPQLIAGPIVRYRSIAEELKERHHTIEGFALGARRFILGLSKKVLIANTLGELCDIFKTSGDKSVLFFWLYAVAFSLHIYFDFSGYSDMAIGLGRILGFHFPENFNYPYISKSVTEFWRRWHMTLGSWFRDYLYIPLGGNRVVKWRWYVNILIVWIATGFWHGADWTFMIWGLFFAVLLVAEKRWLLKYLEKSRVLSRVYLLLAVLVSFVIFNSTDMAEALREIGAMFGMGGYPLISDEFFYYLKSFGGVLLCGIVGATPLMKNLLLKLERTPHTEKLINLSEPVILLILLLAVTAYLVDGSFNPFLYFRF